MHDRLSLPFSNHTAKKDRIVLGKDAGLSYELYTALLLGDREGRPVAPLRLRLRSQGGVHDSDRSRRRPAAVHRDGLTALLGELRELGLPRPLVPILDAEGDSIYHLRRWQAGGHTFLVRTDDQRVVRHQGVEQTLPELVRRLRRHLSRDTNLYAVTGHQLLRAQPAASERPRPSSLPSLAAPACRKRFPFTTAAAAPARPDAWPCTARDTTLPCPRRVKRRRALQACNPTEG